MRNVSVLRLNRTAEVTWVHKFCCFCRLFEWCCCFWCWWQNACTFALPVANFLNPSQSPSKNNFPPSTRYKTVKCLFCAYKRSNQRAGWHAGCCTANKNHWSIWGLQQKAFFVKPARSLGVTFYALCFFSFTWCRTGPRSFLLILLDSTNDVTAGGKASEMWLGYVGGC